MRELSKRKIAIVMEVNEETVGKLKEEVEQFFTGMAGKNVRVDITIRVQK